MSKWFDKVEEAIGPVLLTEEQQNLCEYSHDLTAYSADGKRCVYIYDFNNGCEYEYLLIASQKLYGQWSLGEVLEFTGHDGIDVMCQVDMYLTMS